MEEFIGRLKKEVDKYIIEYIRTNDESCIRKVKDRIIIITNYEQMIASKNQAKATSYLSDAVKSMDFSKIDLSKVDFNGVLKNFNRGGEQ